MLTLIFKNLSSIKFLSSALWGFSCVQSGSSSLQEFYSLPMVFQVSSHNHQQLQLYHARLYQVNNTQVRWGNRYTHRTHWQAAWGEGTLETRHYLRREEKQPVIGWLFQWACWEGRKECIAVGWLANFDFHNRPDLHKVDVKQYLSWRLNFENDSQWA